MMMMMIAMITLIATLWQEDRNNKNGANILGGLSKICYFERGNQPFHEIHKGSQVLTDFRN